MNEFTDFGHYYNSVPLLSEEKLVELVLAIYGFNQIEKKQENGNVIFEVPSNLIEKLDVAINYMVVNENKVTEMSNLVNLDKFYNDSNIWLQTLKAKYKIFFMDYNRNNFYLLLNLKNRKSSVLATEEKIENTLKQYDPEILENVVGLVEYIDSLEIPFKKAYRK